MGFFLSLTENIITEENIIEKCYVNHNKVGQTIKKQTKCSHYVRKTFKKEGSRTVEKE